MGLCLHSHICLRRTYVAYSCWGNASGVMCKACMVWNWGIVVWQLFSPNTLCMLKTGSMALRMQMKLMPIVCLSVFLHGYFVSFTPNQYTLSRESGFWVHREELWWFLAHVLEDCGCWPPPSVWNAGNNLKVSLNVLWWKWIESMWKLAWVICSPPGQRLGHLHLGCRWSNIPFHVFQHPYKQTRLKRCQQTKGIAWD